MNDYPKIINNANCYEVILAYYVEDDSYLKNIEFILDYNNLHDIIGIEIINFKDRVGNNSLEKIQKVLGGSSHPIKYSYDNNTDCFYLQIADENSFDQEAVDGIVVLNENRSIISFRVCSGPSS